MILELTNIPADLTSWKLLMFWLLKSRDGAIHSVEM